MSNLNKNLVEKTGSLLAILIAIFSARLLYYNQLSDFYKLQIWKRKYHIIYKDYINKNFNEIILASPKYVSNTTKEQLLKDPDIIRNLKINEDIEIKDYPFLLDAKYNLVKDIYLNNNYS